MRTMVVRAGGIEALRRAILDSAEETAGVEIERAEAYAREKIERAKSEAEAERGVIIGEAERQAEVAGVEHLDRGYDRAVEKLRSLGAWVRRD